MLKDRILYLNGKFVEWDGATVHLMSHSFARGSAIFEVMSFHKTDAGPAVFRLDEHIIRLFRTADLLSMELPLSREATQEAVLATVKANGLREGAIKVVCYYSGIAFDVTPPQKPLDVAIVAVDPASDFDGLTLSASKGVSACVCKWRKLHPETVPVEAKAAANYLNGMLARQEANKRGFDIGIMLDTEGFVAEGSMESVFLVKDGVLMTPTLGTVLKGITRKSILEAASRTGIQTTEERFKPEALMEADEIFVSCSPEKIVPVKRIDDRQVEKAPGPISQELFSLFEGICAGKDLRFKNWLFLV